MSPRPRKKKILVLGSGALKIGQAGEFDYSGSQALKVLREEGYATVLINPNIATVQTTGDLADEIYFSPVTPDFVKKVIEREKPWGLLLSFGGQTALNCGIELNKKGVLKKHKVRVLGTPVATILDTEDRDRFVRRLKEIDVLTAKSIAANSKDKALKAAEKIGLPVMVRAGFALGGQGSGICRTQKQLSDQLDKAFAYAPQVLIEESLYGWKEIEYEVVRDKKDNCITVCNMENFDPLGVHTGESIVVAPSQTLTNDEYHFLRSIATKTVRHLGVVGECNIQYALHPTTGEYRVIEVNARLSRSSALASKATGYPLAAVAARIALGRTLPEIENAVTRVTKACFEPALDYVVVKIPRWDLRKFRGAFRDIGSQMKSVGEVMAIGRSFEEALQKAVRMVDNGHTGVWDPFTKIPPKDLDACLREPSEQRLFCVATALAQGMSVEEICKKSHINEWFIRRIEHIVSVGKRIKKGPLNKETLLEAKKVGYADRHITSIKEHDPRPGYVAIERVRNKRKKLGIIPVVKEIDTLAGEFPAQTNYLYLTYHGSEHDVERIGKEAVTVIGGGVYRIGSSVEFDWCCVQALQTLRQKKIPAIVINYNPETVSTDYDESDRLYFEELSQERVRDILDFEKPHGCIASFGGQTSNNLVMPLHRSGIRILGTHPENIDQAEDRHKFSSLLDELEIDQPRWKELTNVHEARQFAKRVGYPVLVRPSYVLSGAAMRVVYDDKTLVNTLREATDVSPEHPVVISDFIVRAKEIEFDGIAVRGNVVEWAISEHIENAGVHSGDATMVYPPQHVYRETVFRMQRLAAKIAKGLQITGPFNIQFLAKNNWLKVIECNVRASRSFPFVSKVGKRNLARTATRAVLGDTLNRLPKSTLDYKHVGVKAPQFSFSRLPGADPISGVEMASTGEVGCIGEDLSDAFLQAQIATGFTLAKKSVLLSIGWERNRYDLLDSVEKLRELGFTLYATEHTSEFLTEHHIEHTKVFKIHEKKKPNVGALLEEGAFGFMVVIANDKKPLVSHDHYVLRRSAIDTATPLFTNVQVTKTLIAALARYTPEELSVKRWSEWK